jgi:protein involved in polysaccharide export with SLBB domain
MPRFISSLLPLLALALGISACATVKRLTPDLSKLPKPPIPSFSTLKKITHIIPGMPETDKAAEDDPVMPFNARGTLGYGHSLRIHVYEGSRSPKRIFNQVVMVDSKGLLDLGVAGSARVGGASLPKAADAIAATFRVGLRLSRTVSVHILSVEDTPVVSVRGDVLADEFIPAWEGMTVDQAVRVSGGRKLGSTAHGVYLIREGERRYFSTLNDANELEPEPGDIIELSPDI